jgi:ubiquitin carboxyl-terminal hydrolase MINDY-1/2
MTASLTLADRPFSEYSTSFHPSTLNLNSAFQKQNPERTLELPEDSCSQPPTLLSKASVDSHPAPVASGSLDDLVNNGMGSLSSALSKGLSGSAQDSLPNARSPIVPYLEKALPPAPVIDDPLDTASSDISASIGPASASPSQDTAFSQGKSTERAHAQEESSPTLPGAKRSRGRNAEAEMSKLRGQRNETYQIKQFNWFDHNTRSLRRSSMLTQNENGPCPLLALVNALILGNDSRSALGTALQRREQVSLGLIIESLMDELTSEERGGQPTELPDVDELNRFLLMLHTGMTANPRLAPPTAPSPNLMDARNSSLHLPLSLNNDRRPGTFEETQAMRLYGAFGIPLVHGWLAPRSDPARAAFLRSAPTYEDAQTILFREDELEEKLSRVGLDAEEQQLLQDVSSIKTFLESYPTQITPFGLDIINESLFPASACILFRNDHFSTIYKHPESGQLFTLVTDAGYSDRDEVIWESLVDVSGQDGEFFSGDFRPIGHAEAVGEVRESRSDGSSTNPATRLSTQSYGVASPASPQEQQQQADADFAMALQLQEEEEARMDDSRRRSAVNDLMTGRDSGRSNSSRSRDQEPVRPPIPPRNVRSQGVTRPVDPNSDEAPPPAYEEAAKGRPYIPPSGHPQHPSFDGRSPTSGPSIPMHPPGPGARQAAPRRMSAFQETSQFQPSPPLARPHSNNNFGVAQSSGRPRDRDKDCIVM